MRRFPRSSEQIGPDARLVDRVAWLLVAVLGFTLALLACGHPGSKPAASAPLWSLEPASYLSGYRRTIEGDPFPYHSPHPDVRTALLSRAADDPMEIAWETDPVPPGLRGEAATFVWMCGIDRGAVSRDFHLSVNGRRMFTFTTFTENADESWEIGGEHGARLAFKPVLTDRYDDLMGFMYLEMPEALVEPGRPLQIQVVGEPAGSRDWYMTFEHPVAERVTLVPEPALVREGGEVRQLVRIDIERLGEAVEALVQLDGRIIGRLPVKLGYNTLSTALPAVDEPTDLVLKVEVPGSPALEHQVRLSPVVPIDMYLLHHSHVDIGYTHIQDEVVRIQTRNLEQALELAERSRGHDEGARFKWNTEVMWVVDEYLRRATAEQRRRLVDAVRDGSIGLDGMYANVMTGLSRPEELMELFASARELSREIGVPVDAAMIIDIPGYTWGLVPAMARSGIRYFAIGTNTSHRIGSILSRLGDRPFYWESPSGQERVLCWVAGRGYSWFHTGLGAAKIENRLRADKLLEYIRELEASDWPYSMAAFHYNIGSDNGPPDAMLADYVRDWNRRFVTPRLIIATTSEMMGELERRHGAELPVLRGDLTPYWEDGAASSALETAINRRSAERLVQAETLWAVFGVGPYPRTRFAEAWRNVLLFSEHTWGSYNSISEPDAEFTRRQWKIKRSFATEADRISRGLHNEALRVGGTNEPAVLVRAMDVINTASWNRTDVVYIARDVKLAGDRVRDGSRALLPSQRLSTGELAVLVRDVPAFGAKRLHFERGQAPGRGTAIVEGNSIDNGRLRVELHPETGAIASLQRDGIELVDRSSGFGLNDYLYVAGRDPGAPERSGKVKIEVSDAGPLVGTLGASGSAPGSRSLRRQVRLVDGLDRVEIATEMDKLRVTDPEGVHIAFPFDVADPVVRIDAAWGHYRAGIDQLPGSCKNYFTVQRWVDISGDGLGVTWTPIDAPMIEIGALGADATVAGWRDEVTPSSKIYSYVMNNYWETNFRAFQEGPTRFEYAVRAHSGFDPTAATKFGIERSQPLVVAVADPSRGPPASLLAVEPAAVIATRVTRPEPGAALVRLFNTSAQPVDARVRWRGGTAVSYRSSPFGVRGERLRGPISMPGQGIVTVRIEPRCGRIPCRAGR